MLRAALAALIAITAVVLPPAASANASTSREAFERCLLDKANEARAQIGVAPLLMADDLVDPVRDWSRWMRFNEFRHMNSSERDPILPDSWTTWGENIAYWGDPNLPDCSQMHDMWMNSAGHRENILRSTFKYVAIGTYVDSSGWWGTQLFFNASDYGPGCNGTFCDDDDSDFEDAIEKIAAAGITQGCNPPTNNRFCPDTYITRGAMAAFLARALDLPNGPSIDFVDDNNSIFEDAIEKIAAAGITQGCNPPTNNRFCPDTYITRGAMAAFLARALDLPNGPSIDFVDDNNSIFEDAIEKIAAAGITQGCNPPTNNRFCPDTYITRGQMAAFLARALDL